MYGRTNAGGDIKAFAFIFATYPIGSTCTATDGSRTLKLKDTSGYGVFYVPYAATWTVTATDGTETASKTVNITSEGQSVSVELSYELWLYKRGNEYSDVTGGWESVAYTTGVAVGSITKNADSISLNTTSLVLASVGTTNAIDLTQYKKLKCIYNAPNDGSIFRMYVASTFPTTSYVAQTSKAGTGDGVTPLELDISEVTGSYKICLTSGNVTALSVLEVWLE